MASYTLHPGFDSPAKVFAKLKSKVRKEAMLAQEGSFSCDNVREQRGAQFNSPRKKTANPWTIDELQDNQRFDSYCSEAQALTLSPISSPQKACGYCKPMEETSPVDVRGGRAFLESTAMSQSLPLAIRDQTSKGTPQITDLNGFIVSSNTAVKMQPTGNCGRNTFGKEDVPFRLSTELSPMRTRLRKRTCKDPVSNKISRTTEITRKPPSTEDYTLNKTYMQDLDGRSFPIDQSEMTQDALTTRFISHMRCNVVLEKLPVMSPAKMFASMKEREKNKKERREVPNSSRRELFDGDKRRLHEFRDTSVLTAHSMSETEESTLKSTPEATMLVDSTDGQSNIDDSPSQPILLEDPLVINSPHILIPKKDKGVFRRNQWPQHKRFPVESVIYLKRWFLRRNEKGLFVDGIHGEDNVPWNSNIIVERVSSSVLKTVSGRIYILVGKMKMNLASGFPRSFLKKFVCGFPPNWNILFEKFLLESKNTDTKNYNKKKAEASINQSVKRKTQKSLKTPASCSPASSSSSTQVTRSGRTIKPPLEYWKGARVILDAHMNVTIHESYDSSQSEVSTIVSPRSSMKQGFLPSSEGLKQSESAKDEEASTRVRKSRAQSNRNTTKKPADLPESTSEVFKVPEQCFGRITRSNQRRPHPVMERTCTVPEKQRESEKFPTQRSPKQTNDTNRSLLRSNKRTVVNYSEPPVADKTSSHLPSNDEIPKRRKKPSGSSKDNWKDNRKGDRREKKSDKETRCTKTSPELAQLGKKRPANIGTTVKTDEDEWTEAELMKLQEAVSYYPKHSTGYWAKVAQMVGTRSAEDCYKQRTSQGTSEDPKRTGKVTKKKVEASKPSVTECPVITARVGTLKRKQEVRQFLTALPREDTDDAFSSTYMQNKRFEIPSLCSCEEQDFEMSDLDPQTPRTSRFPEVKTPQNLHITPGMLSSPNTKNDDKCVYQLQKKIKKNQFNVCRTTRSTKRFIATPSVKRTVQRCGNTENDIFCIREMFPANNGELSDSKEEEDFYFSDH